MNLYAIAAIKLENGFWHGIGCIRGLWIVLFGEELEEQPAETLQEPLTSSQFAMNSSVKSSVCADQGLRSADQSVETRFGSQAIYQYQNHM